MDPKQPLPPGVDADREQLSQMDPSALDDMFAGVAAATVDRAPGPLDRLAELPTPLRYSLATAGMLASGVGLLTYMGLRSDLTGAVMPQFVTAMFVLLAVSATSAGLALRGMHRPSTGSRQIWGIVLLALLLPTLLSVIPGIWPGKLIGPDAPFMMHMWCFGRGVIATVGTTLSLLLFLRADRVPPYRLLAAAGAGGLVGTATQQLYCVAIDPIHLIISHSTLGLTAAALAYITAKLLGRA